MKPKKEGERKVWFNLCQTFLATFPRCRRRYSTSQRASFEHDFSDDEFSTPREIRRLQLPPRIHACRFDPAIYFPPSSPRSILHGSPPAKLFLDRLFSNQWSRVSSGSERGDYQRVSQRLLLFHRVVWTINKIRLNPVSRSVAILATFQYIRETEVRSVE